MVPLRNRRDCAGGGVRVAVANRTARPRQPDALPPRRRSSRFRLCRTWLHAFCDVSRNTLNWQRWYHVPIFLAFISLVLFAHYYLGTGRLWLLWTIILMRSVVLVVNFSVHPSFNFVSIDSLRRMSLLGEQISVIAAAVPRTDWQMFAFGQLVPDDSISRRCCGSAMAEGRAGTRDERRLRSSWAWHFRC